MEGTEIVENKQIGKGRTVPRAKYLAAKNSCLFNNF